MSKLNGLVLMGGQSKRMQSDKALLCYHGMPQYQYVYNLLSAHCNKVYLSKQFGGMDALPVIIDAEQYRNIGPMAGLLSAYEKENTAWILLAIDYPYIGDAEIEKLVLAREEKMDATVCFNNSTGFYEPFIGIYEASFFENLLNKAEANNFSLQKILQLSKVKKVTNIDPSKLKSIDTNEAYLQTKNEIDENN